MGGSTSASGDHALVWKKQTGIVDLNTTGPNDLGIVLMEAHAINRKGEILAMGRSAEAADMKGHYCAPSPPLTFLLTPPMCHKAYGLL